MKNRFIYMAILSLLIVLSYFVLGYIIESKYSKVIQQYETSEESILSEVDSLKKINTDALLLVKQKDNTIDSLITYKDVDVNYTSGFTLNGKSISTEELLSILNNKFDETNRLKKEIATKNEIISATHHNLSIMLDRLGIKYKIENGFIHITDVNSNKRVLDTNTLDSLSNLIHELEIKNQANNSILNLIEKNYDIKGEYSVEGNMIKTKIRNTEKLDSALWLLPYYKHKIKTNKRGETFIK